MARREVAALRASGTDVVVLRPDQEVQEAMGNDFMARDRVKEIVQQAFLSTGAYAARHPETLRLLGALSQRRRTSA